MFQQKINIGDLVFIEKEVNENYINIIFYYVGKVYNIG